MPHPSGPNAYPSGPGNYPSAPDLWLATAAGTVTSSSVTDGFTLGGGVAEGAATSGGTAELTYVWVLLADGTVTSSAEPIIVSHFVDATGENDSGGDATASQDHRDTAAHGEATSSPAWVDATLIPGPRGIVTSSGAATANRTYASNPASGTVTSSATLVGGLVLAATATGTNTSIGTSRVTLAETAAVVAADTSTGTANGVRVADAEATGAITSSGSATSRGRLFASAPGTDTATASADPHLRMFVSATGAADARGEVGGARSATGSATSSGAATAEVFVVAVVAVTVTSRATVDGRRVVNGAASGQVTSGGLAGGVIAWQHAASGTVTATAVVNSVQFHPALAVPPGPVKPQVAVPRQRLLVVDTVTGRLAAELPYSALSWQAPLNDETTCTASIPVDAALDAVSDQGARNPRQALEAILTGPFRFSLVVAYGNVAIQGGPLLPTDDEQDAIVTVAGAGMERMLDRRLLLRRLPENEDFLAASSRDVVFPDTNMANAIVQIAAEAMATYLVPRPLPIYCTNLPATTGTETFTHFSYDAKTAWKAITDLTGRADGPDMRLEPMLSEDSDGVYVWWDLQIGAPTFDVPPGNYGPTGPLPWTWDDAIARVSRTVDSVGMATDTIASGTGSERDRLLCEAVDNTLVGWGFPVLEVLDNGATSIKTLDLLQKRADAYEAAHKLPTDTWTVDARIDGEPPLGAFRRGDVARLEIRRKLLIPPGDYLRRITKVASNSTDPSTVSVTCAYEDPLGEVEPSSS